MVLVLKGESSNRRVDFREKNKISVKKQIFSNGRFYFHKETKTFSGDQNVSTCLYPKKI